MKNKLVLLLLILLFTFPVYSQTFQAQKDNLSALRDSLNSEKDFLNTYTDSLAHYIDALDKEISNCETETVGLKKKLYFKKYGKVNGQRVLEGRVWKGMTEDMLKDIWGKPDKTHTDRHSWGVFTQWYYGDITYYFKNSVLIDWEQDTKENK